MNHSHLNRLLLIIVCVAVAFTAGCASSKQSGAEASSASSASSSSPDKLKKDRDLQGVWVKPGFNFGGKPTLFIEPSVYKAVERPNEVQMREFATRELRQQIADAARETGVFGAVSTDAAAPTNSLRLVNTIVEYEKGGGGARYFAGLYGGGQPVIKVRGEMFDASNERVLVYEAKRSGEKASARLVGVFLSDEEIQRNDIHDLAIDLGDFIMRTAGLTPPKR
jgi:hypothetical protein